ncbi:hypothetical protein EPUL_004752 [Erysiphe pulchra]|uniref:Uncharacterized protein n=1 Tax=Erysiphe pulchra TaxID=225359 RepID=A0A2S4PWR9_9PEZI|nr:hypothetical protein EPUL_004752 [Erysiphe pulchra]
MSGITPSIEHIRVSKSKCYSYVNPKPIPVGQRHDKLQLGVYSPELGYTFKSSRVLIDERVKGGSIDLKFRKSTFGPQGTANVMPDRKHFGRPRKDASYTNQLSLPQQVENNSQKLLILQSYLCQRLNLHRTYYLSLLDNIPAVISPISGLPNSDSEHKPSLSTTIDKMPEKLSLNSDSTKLTHSMALSKNSSEEKENNTTKSRSSKEKSNPSTSNSKIVNQISEIPVQPKKVEVRQKPVEKLNLVDSDTVAQI